MKLILTTVLLLGACSCSHAPVSSAQHDVSVLENDFVAAVQREANYARLPPCGVVANNGCMSHVVRQRLITANYRASGALLSAQSEQTDAAIKVARMQIAAFSLLVSTLPVAE